MRIATFAILMCTLAGPAHSDFIGIFGNTACTGSSSSIASGETVTLYVMAEVTDAVAWANGFDGVEYRIVGLPSTWSATAASNPQAAVQIGDPFGSGTNLAFTTNQPGCVLLHTIQIHATSALTDVVLSIAGREPPSQQQYACPWLYLECFGPCEGIRRCVDTFNYTLNPTVGVEGTAWTALKQLYR